MAKTIQYRCPSCCRLLFKHEVNSDHIQAMPNVQFIKTPEEKMDVICNKCGKRLEICKGELKEIELELVRHPAIPQAL